MIYGFCVAENEDETVDFELRCEGPLEALREASSALQGTGWMSSSFGEGALSAPSQCCKVARLTRLHLAQSSSHRRRPVLVVGPFRLDWKGGQGKDVVKMKKDGLALGSTESGKGNANCGEKVEGLPLGREDEEDDLTNVPAHAREGGERLADSAKNGFGTGVPLPGSLLLVFGLCQLGNRIVAVGLNVDGIGEEQEEKEKAGEDLRAGLLVALADLMARLPPLPKRPYRQVITGSIGGATESPRIPVETKQVGSRRRLARVYVEGQRAVLEAAQTWVRNTSTARFLEPLARFLARAAEVPSVEEDEVVPPAGALYDEGTRAVEVRRSGLRQQLLVHFSPGSLHPELKFAHFG